MPRFGKAGRFNGTTSQLTVSTSLNSLMGNPVTEASVSFWIRNIGSDITPKKIMSFFYFELSSDKATFNLGAGNIDYPFGNNKWRYYEWNHICITKSVLDTKVYLNGNQIISLGTPTLSSIANRAIVDNRVGYDGTTFFELDLDQYREYSRALRQEEIDLLYNEIPYKIDIGTSGFINRLSDTVSSFADGASDVYDYKVFMFGGRDGADTANNKFQVYDLLTNTVADSTTTPAVSIVGAPSARYGAASTVHKGKWYVVGGQTNVTTFSDAFTFEWDASAGAGVWSPIMALPTAISGGKLVSFEDHLYYFGGIETGATYSSNIYKYDPVTNTWTTPVTGLLWKNGFLPQNEVMYRNSAYFFGNVVGGTPKDEVWEFNFSTSTMSQINEGRAITGLVGAQSSMIDKELVIMGGYDATGPANQNRLMKYDVTTDTWKTDEALHASYIQKANASIITFSNAYYIFGGFNNDRNPTNSTFVYFV